MADYKIESIKIVRNERNEPVYYMVEDKPCDLIQVTVDLSGKAEIDMKPLKVYHFFPHGKLFGYGEILLESYDYLLLKGLIKQYKEGHVRTDGMNVISAYLDAFDDFYDYGFYPVYSGVVSDITNIFVKHHYVLMRKEEMVPVKSLPLNSIYRIENLDGPMAEAVTRLVGIWK